LCGLAKTITVPHLNFVVKYAIWCGVQGMTSWFWTGLAKSKTDFFFLGQILNCWTSYLFIYFRLAYPNQHMLGKFGPAQSFVFVFVFVFFLARK